MHVFFPHAHARSAALVSGAMVAGALSVAAGGAHAGTLADVPAGRAVTVSQPTRANWFQPEHLRWAMQHGREVAPTTAVLGSEAAQPLPHGAPLELDNAILQLPSGERATFQEYLRSNVVDGLLVMHKGRVVHETYFGRLGPRQPHTWASMAKSVVGILALELAHEKRLDLDAPLGRYVPELAGSPFGQATVQQNLDMAVALAYPPQLPPDIGMFTAAGLLPPKEGMPTTIEAFLQKPTPTAVPHGSLFYYQNGSTEAVAWALSNITGQSLADMVSARIWQPMGAQDAGYYIVDKVVREFASGGLNSTLRDAARFGELLRNQGRVGDRQVLSAATVKHVFAAPSLDNQARVRAAGRARAGGTGYANFWWHPMQEPGAIAAQGRFGQRIYVDPSHELTVVQFGSYPDGRARPVTPGQAAAPADNPWRTDDGLVALAHAITEQLAARGP